MRTVIAIIAAAVSSLLIIATGAQAQWIADEKGSQGNVRLMPLDEVQKTLSGRPDALKGLEGSLKEILSTQSRVTDIYQKNYGRPVSPALEQLLSQPESGAEVEPFISSAFPRTWLCVLDSSDVNTCNALENQCYVGANCDPGYAINGLFGGCAGLMCICRDEEGNTWEDGVGIDELNRGQINCDADIDRNTISFPSQSETDFGL